MSVQLEDQLAKLGRYEALFELADAINASADIESTSQALAGRLKYVTDVFGWRYLSLDEGGPGPSGSEPAAIVIDGFRGRAEVAEAGAELLSSVETELWSEHRARILCEGADAPELEHLPDYFRRPDIVQTYSLPLTATAEQRAVLLFCKRREPFNDLDIKFMKVVGTFFHRRVQMLWEQRKLRALETAYLEQEITLRQSEKLATLGRMSAGMAHELNNPAAASLRSAEQLREEIGRLEVARTMLGALGLSAPQRDLVMALEQRARERASRPSEIDALERSDLEDRLEDWLDARGVEDPWDHAPALVAIGESAESLVALEEMIPDGALGAAIATVTSHHNVHRLLEEMGHGVGRISEIVGALKSYSYMDKAPIQQVDVRQGLDDTLVMLHNKLKKGVAVERDYAEDVPSVEAYGGELNQVWTNIIDNAIAAMNGDGRIDLRVVAEGEHVVVEISDNGPGIPPAILDKIFDPFFTTKVVGEGTGLGLNISHNIITQKHGGELSVASKPGRTTFTAKLPLTLEGPDGKADHEEAESSAEELRQSEDRGEAA